MAESHAALASFLLAVRSMSGLMGMEANSTVRSDMLCGWSADCNMWFAKRLAIPVEGVIKVVFISRRTNSNGG
jgi:hypothetical protein